MSQPIVIRCKTKTGQHTLRNLSTKSTLLELKAQLMALTGLEYNQLSLKLGFPPKPIIITENETTLSECKITHGDTIIVEEIHLKGNCTEAPQQYKRKLSASDPNDVPDRKNVKVTRCNSLMRMVVPANNSCLFTSINYCLNNGKSVDNTSAAHMRKIVADAVLSDKMTYCEALLGKGPSEYAVWIQNSNSWGGAIELAILSKHYKVEIDVVDIQNTRIEKVGEGPAKRILLIYDGIHYDPLYEANGTARNTIFSINNDAALAQALSLADSENSNRRFTDANKFKLKCLACQKGFVGAHEANAHAKETNHVNFGEY